MRKELLISVDTTEPEIMATIRRDFSRPDNVTLVYENAKFSVSRTELIQALTEIEIFYRDIKPAESIAPITTDGMIPSFGDDNGEP